MFTISPQMVWLSMRIMQRPEESCIFNRRITTEKMLYEVTKNNADIMETLENVDVMKTIDSGCPSVINGYYGRSNAIDTGANI
ncbi:hypothetical protein LIER_43341 [Lithospermum erythrorhizon]|uniref:Uncharacterized protein n=1 Tax=Lithospermum erythrorhizon TaxID=34254 RepID=A0AAV3PYJ3_LITER